MAVNCTAVTLVSGEDWADLHVLRGKIERGELEPGRPVPSQRSLVQEYGLARGTVARAVATLVEEGLVVIVPGKGAYVPPNRD